MTPERAKELLPIIQAFAEGKKIQFRDKGDVNWNDDRYEEPNLRFFDNSEYRIKPEEEKTQFPGGESLKHKVDTEISPKDKTVKHYHHSDITSNPPVTHLSEQEKICKGCGRPASVCANEDKVVFEGTDYKIIDKDKVLGGTFHCFRCDEKDAEIIRLKTLQGIQYCEGKDRVSGFPSDWQTADQEPKQSLSHQYIMELWWKKKHGMEWRKVSGYMNGKYYIMNYGYSTVGQLLEGWDYAEIPPQE